MRPKLRVFLFHRFPCRKACHKNGRLGVDCEIKLFLRTFEAKSRKRKSKNAIRAFENGAGLGKNLADFFSHARILSALAGEKKGKGFRGAYHFTTHAAQVRPLPNATITTFEPG